MCLGPPIEALTWEFAKFNGKPATWIDYMRDRDISARHAVGEVIKNNWRDPQNGGHWRRFDSLVAYAEPLRPYSWDEVLN